jgi:probable selenium-dependent hydroxylase accessory protein YqeC
VAKSVTSLTEALGIGDSEHLALVGAGGKTSLLIALAGELQGASRAVLASTTTKMWHREASWFRNVCLREATPSWREDVRRGLGREGLVFLAARLLDSGKVQGVGPELLDTLFREEAVDCLVVEADGSAGHPVKAPASHEPVIPQTATAVVALMGLEALGRPLGPETVFRPEIFQGMTGIRPGGVLRPVSLARLFLDPEGIFKGAPGTARRVVLLNKRELLSGEESAEELADLILGDAGSLVERVVIGSLRMGAYTVHRPR